MLLHYCKGLKLILPFSLSPETSELRSWQGNVIHHLVLILSIIKYLCNGVSIAAETTTAVRCSTYWDHGHQLERTKGLFNQVLVDGREFRRFYDPPLMQQVCSQRTRQRKGGICSLTLVDTKLTSCGMQFINLSSSVLERFPYNVCICWNFSDPATETFWADLNL